MNGIQLSKTEAINAVTRAAFTVQDPESSEFGRTIVHSFRGFLGADWDLGAVVEEIGRSRSAVWMPTGILGGTHPVLVTDQAGRSIRFEGKRDG